MKRGADERECVGGEGRVVDPDVVEPSRGGRRGALGDGGRLLAHARDVHHGRGAVEEVANGARGAARDGGRERVLVGLDEGDERGGPSREGGDEAAGRAVAAQLAEEDRRRALGRVGARGLGEGLDVRDVVVERGGVRADDVRLGARGRVRGVRRLAEQVVKVHRRRHGGHARAGGETRRGKLRGERAEDPRRRRGRVHVDRRVTHRAIRAIGARGGVCARTPPRRGMERAKRHDGGWTANEDPSENFVARNRERRATAIGSILKPGRVGSRFAATSVRTSRAASKTPSRAFARDAHRVAPPSFGRAL